MDNKTVLLICGLALVVIGIASFAASWVLGVILIVAAVVVLIASLRTRTSGTE